MSTTSSGIQHFPAAYIDHGREWIADCEWRNLTPDECHELAGRWVMHGIDVHYEGGLVAFAGAVR